MDRILKKILPIVAGISIALAVISAALLTLQRQTLTADTGETRSSVEDALDRVLGLQPASIDAESFRQTLSDLGDEPYVVYVWLFTPEGEILQGNQAISEGWVDQRATTEMQRVTSALPDGTLSAAQRTQLLAASVMQAEGEHNDVFRYLLREVQGSDGTPIALVGVTYDVSSQVGTPGSVWIATLIAGLTGWGTYWIALPVWVWLDARTRGERAWVWATFVLLGNLVALIAYILARVPRQMKQ